MKNNRRNSPIRSAARSNYGFTLVELMVSIAVFLVVASAAFSLFATHAPLFTRQQNSAGLNITLRNAVTQMELDVSNAGSGFYPSADFPGWPIGLTINNNSGTGCYTASTKTYASTCFDTLNIIGIDQTVPPAQVFTTCSAGNNTDTSTSISIVIPTAPEYTGSNSAYAAMFKNGDKILFVNNNGSRFATATLTAAGTVSGSNVVLAHTLTGTSSSDPLGMTVYAANHVGENYSDLGNQFCNNAGTADWVMKLAETTYWVDATTNPASPRLMRTSPNGTQDIVAEQIIGFKVGATLWWNPAWDPTANNDAFRFDNANYNSYDPAQIRSVLVSLIARTSPNLAGDTNFRNSFDNGNYQVQALSVVINPRNLSMRDQ